MNVENLREIETKTGEIVKTKKNETKNREDALFLHFLQLKTNPMSLFTKQTKNWPDILTLIMTTPVITKLHKMEQV